jgi:hypothetical protein
MASRGWDRVAATTVASLLMLASTAFQSVTGGFEAAAQQTTGPSKDAPAMSAGQRVERPFGAIEISNFTSAQKDQDTIFTIQFLVRNESRGQAYVSSNSFRLIADGVPRAPEGWSGSCCDISVATDSADYGWATFRVRGLPHEVYLQIGTRDEGRTYLRGPE